MLDKINAATSAAKAIIREPWCALSLLFLFYMGSAATDKYLLEGQPVTGALQFMADRALAFAQLPLVQLLMIPLALWMFGHGVRNVMRQGAARAAADAIFAEASEVSAKASAARIEAHIQRLETYMQRGPNLAILAIEKARELDRFSHMVSGLREHVNQERERISQLYDGAPRVLGGFDAWKVHFRITDPHQFHFATFAVDVPPVSVSASWPKHTRLENGTILYDPNENAEFIAGLQSQIQTVDGYVSALEARRDDVVREIDAVRNHVFEEIKSATTLK